MKLLARAGPAILLCGVILAVVALSSVWSYYEGRAVLRGRVDAQLQNSGRAAALASERALAALVATMESWAQQPVMVRILDQDADREIAGLLEMGVKRFPEMRAIECLAADGHAIAWSGAAAGADGGPKLPVRWPEKARATITEQGSEIVVTVPIHWMFDEVELLGVLRATVALGAFVSADQSWWTGLAAEDGRVLAQAGPVSVEQVDLGSGAGIFRHGVDVVQSGRLLALPEQVQGPRWHLLVAERTEEVYRPITLLRGLVTRVTVGSGFVLAVIVLLFSAKQRRLILRIETKAREFEKLSADLAAEVDVRRHAEVELQTAHDQLEARVAQRTAELGSSNHRLLQEIAERKQAQKDLEEMHRQLVAASRAAGMAEVATGVLHNVGNVLNSVNVSTTLLREHVRGLRVNRLATAAGMLRDHQVDLAAFLSNDPKGRLVPGFIVQLSLHIQEQCTQFETELSGLAANVDHIKQIVTRQQTYARVSGVLEKLAPVELVEDALRLNENALAGTHIEVVREFAKTPLVLVDKHKVLQILINLIRNAEHALAAGPESKARRLTVKVHQAKPDEIEIVVADNGPGIAQENLTRIFQHGFTTKKEGHGFGLHSGALAAQEIGGGLRAESEGSGRGATFTLTLPIAGHPVGNVVAAAEPVGR